MKKMLNIIACLSFIPFVHAVEIQSWQLDNGAKVMFVESHQIPIVDISVSFDAGNRRDRADKIGVASFTASLMDTGAGSLNEEQIRTKASELAIDIGSGADLESASIELRSLSKKDTLQPALKLANLIISHPNFDEKILKREQERAVLGLKQGETSPNFLASRAIKSLNYSNHPYGFSAKITEQSIRAITRADLVKFYQQCFVTEGAIVSIVGDVTREEANKIAEDILKGLSKGNKLAAIEEVNVVGGQSKNIPHPASQAHVVLSLPVFTRDDPDYYELLVGNYILGGGGFDSRLMKVLRDEKGMVYGVSSNFIPYAQKGEFMINFSTKKEQANEALALTKSTLTEYLQQGPTQKELEQAKNNIIGGFPLRFDSNVKLLPYLDVIGRYNLPLSFLNDYPEKVRKLTTQDIQKAWKNRISVEKLNIVIVGGK